MAGGLGSLDVFLRKVILMDERLADLVGGVGVFPLLRMAAVQ